MLPVWFIDGSYVTVLCAVKVNVRVKAYCLLCVVYINVKGCRCGAVFVGEQWHCTPQTQVVCDQPEQLIFRFPLVCAAESDLFLCLFVCCPVRLHPLLVLKCLVLRLINPLNTKRRLLYLKTQLVPLSKHFSSLL